MRKKISAQKFHFSRRSYSLSLCSWIYLQAELTQNKSANCRKAPEIIHTLNIQIVPCPSFSSDSTSFYKFCSADSVSGPLLCSMISFFEQILWNRKIGVKECQLAIVQVRESKATNYLCQIWQNKFSGKKKYMASSAMLWRHEALQVNKVDLFRKLLLARCFSKFASSFANHHGLYRLQRVIKAQDTFSLPPWCSLARSLRNYSLAMLRCLLLQIQMLCQFVMSGRTNAVKNCYSRTLVVRTFWFRKM